MDPSFITCDDIGKLFLSYFGNIWSSFLATLTRCLFCSSVNRCGTHLAKIFLTFKCFVKIKLTVDSDVPTFRAISRTVNLASTSMISFIFETISLRDADFGLPDFGVHFDALYTRLKFLFPSPNYVIRHTRRSISSREFSHQLLQRATQFWASFDVSP
jgi:membrane-bound acyltransferase YfiQ involved in biofilm formation